LCITRCLERAIERKGSTIKGQQGTLHFKLNEPVHKRTLGSSATLNTAALPSRSRSSVGSGDRHEPALNDILGSDPQVAEQLKLAQRVYSRCLPLLLQGESGVGKTLLAKSLHQAGPHRDGNFVAINCAAIPHDLIESELFGYRPGSFTGAAKQGSPGRLIAAHGGTLFLDEIGDMPLPLQARLLQVLSEGEFVPVGGVTPVKVRFALITASLRELPPLVREGKFREDLFFRIHGTSLHLPPLRTRKDRARLIEDAFWRAASQAAQPVCELTAEAMEILMAYNWPGNMRELQHVAQFALAISESSRIDPDVLPPALRTPGRAVDEVATMPGLKPRRDAEAILAALTSEHWNVSAAAKRLGISRATLHRKIVEFDLMRPKHR
jgi:transcriptional regulator with PAS, ATPase and Fis domain